MHHLSDYVRTFLTGPFPDRMTAIRSLATRHGERPMLVTELEGEYFGRPWSPDNVDHARWPSGFAVISADDVAALCRPVQRVVEYMGDPSFFPFEDWIVDDDCIDVLDVVQAARPHLVSVSEK